MLYGRHVPTIEEGRRLHATARWNRRFWNDPEFHQKELDRTAARRNSRGYDWRMQWHLRRAFKTGMPAKALEQRFGYTLRELRTHLEASMTGAMTWQGIFTQTSLFTTSAR